MSVTTSNLLTAEPDKGTVFANLVVHQCRVYQHIPGVGSLYIGRIPTDEWSWVTPAEDPFPHEPAVIDQLVYMGEQKFSRKVLLDKQVYIRNFAGRIAADESYTEKIFDHIYQ